MSLLSDEDETFLKDLNQNLTHGPLEPGDPRYVAFESLPEAKDTVGLDNVRLLERYIKRSAPGRMVYLNGLRGCGKSTQLLRLRQNLKDAGYAAVRIDLMDYLYPDQPPEITEFLFYLAGGIADAVVAAGFAPNKGRAGGLWHSLTEWLKGLPPRFDIQTQATGTIAVPMPLGLDLDVDIRAALREDAAFVAKLRRFLDGRLQVLEDQVNRHVGHIAEEVRKASSTTGRGAKGLVVLVDSIDHVRGRDFKATRDALHTLLVSNSDLIRLKDCWTVMVIPPYVRPGVPGERRCVNVRVSSPNSSDPYRPGIDALKQLVSLRVPNGETSRFLEDSQLERLIGLSGGSIRDLMRLLIEIELQTDELPASNDTIERSIQAVRQQFLPLADDVRECLRRVASRHDIGLESEDEGWEQIFSLLSRHMILGYPNHEEWYDIHPLLRPYLDGEDGEDGE
ncbi:MAG: hypothetical protein LBJ08_06640 [Bifidobacteriaceae bacterium]|nr:hypothetical protein [Bifidobacteriaceae bacterium]